MGNSRETNFFFVQGTHIFSKADYSPIYFIIKSAFIKVCVCAQENIKIAFIQNEEVFLCHCLPGHHMGLN